MNKTKIEAISGDILDSGIYDAIVNSTNHTLDPSDSRTLDSKIHKRAGKKLKAECAKIVEEKGKCVTGRALITEAYDLPNFKYIIHTVTPSGYRNGQDEFLLESCYEQVLFIAYQNQVRTIAIPAIGTKYKGIERGRAANIAVSTVNRFCRMHPDAFDRVTFITKDTEQYEMYYGLVALTEEYQNFISIKIDDIHFSRDALYRFLFDMTNNARESLSKDDKNYQKKLTLVSALENSLKLSHDMRLEKTLVIPLRNMYKRILKFMKVFKLSDKISTLRLLSRYVDDVKLINEDGKLALYISAHDISLTEVFEDFIDTSLKNDIIIASLLRSLNESMSNREKGILLCMMLEKAETRQILNNAIEKICDAPGSGRTQEFVRSLELKTGKIDIMIS